MPKFRKGQIVKVVVADCGTSAVVGEKYKIGEVNRYNYKLVTLGGDDIDSPFVVHREIVAVRRRKVKN